MTTNTHEQLVNGLDSRADISAAIEALLFAAQDGLSLAELSQLLEVDEASCLEAVENYAHRLDSEQRGLSLRVVRKRYFLATRTEYNPLVQKLFEDSKLLRLTKAAYECLAVIAYNQPCTRSQVEAVRGVNSDSVIARLLEIDLIEELERLDLPGHPASYGVSERFLKCFGLNLSSDLPKLEMISYSSIQEIEQNLPEELLNR